MESEPRNILIKPVIHSLCISLQIVSILLRLIFINNLSISCRSWVAMVYRNFQFPLFPYKKGKAIKPKEVFSLSLFIYFERETDREQGRDRERGRENPQRGSQESLSDCYLRPRLRAWSHSSRVWCLTNWVTQGPRIWTCLIAVDTH